MKIAIIGTGYVGLTLSALLARVGYKTYCIDVDKKKIDIIKTGKSHFYELGLDTLVKYGIESCNLIPTLDYKEGLSDVDVVFLSVGTPSGPDGGFDLTYIYSAVEQAAKYVKDGVIFVQRSTVPVGTGREAMKRIKKVNPKLKYTYLSSPEFLREGAAVLDSIVQDRIVIGGEDEEAKKKIFKIFEKIEFLSEDIISKNPEISMYANNNMYTNNHSEVDFEKKCMSTKLESAELIKVCSNTMLAMKISYANNIARICDKVDANITEVMDGVGMDRRINRSFLYAGIGFGGGCFPKDVKGLIRSLEEHNVDATLFKAVMQVNTEQIDFVIQKVKDMGTPKKGKVGVLGLSFKPGTSDMRVSPAGRLCKALVKDGYTVVGHDPQAIEEARIEFPEEKGLVYSESIEDVFKDSEMVVVATDWPEFKELDFKYLSTFMKENRMLDARNYLDIKEMSKIFKFENLGA